MDGGCGDPGRGARRSGQHCIRKGRSSKCRIQLPNSRVKCPSVIFVELAAFSVERSRAWPGLIM